MKNLLILFKYTKGVRKTLTIAFLCSLLYGATGGIGVPYIFENVFFKIFEDSEVKKDFFLILGYALLLPGIFIIRGALSYTNSYLMTQAGLEVICSIRQDIFSRIQFLPMKFFDQNNYGDLISRMTVDPIEIQSFMLLAASDGLKQPAQLVAAMSSVIWIVIEAKSPLLIPLLLAAMCISVIPGRFVRRIIKNTSMNAHIILGKINQAISENLDAIVEIKSFNLEKKEIRKHDSLLSQMNKEILRLSRHEKLLHPISEFTSVSAVSILFLYAYLTQMPFSLFSKLGIALYLTIEPAKRLISIYTEYQKVSPSLERIMFVLEAPMGIEDPDIPQPVEKLKGDIQFNNVSFSYHQERTLQNITTRLDAGKKYALIGSSGAGKSTFIKLLCRFYDVNQGGILIDGIDIRNMRIKDLRRNISIVPQHPVLFNDTIYNNILVGNIEAEKPQVYESAKNAIAHDFIQKLAQQYDTPVGDRGDLISGGQKQRIAIARAFLKDSPIIIFDEATASLDAESEHGIKQVIDNFNQEKTLIVIAHRLSTIKKMDEILLFDQGRITDSGSYDELLKHNEQFQKFIRFQTIEHAE